MKPDELVMAAAGSSTAGGGSGGGGGASTLYVDDVFSTYLYTGDGAYQTIANGIDLAGSGGLVWVKGRSGTYGAYNHSLHDTQRGLVYRLSSNNTNAQSNEPSDINSFNSNGFTLSVGALTNDPATAYVAWTFRKAPKFFDIISYTGDGASWRSVSHNLGIRPGLITVKATSTVGDWEVLCRGTDTSWPWLKLNTTAAGGGPYNVGADVGDSTFTVGGIFPNANGVQYVAYIFAHDPSSTGIIQCGSFTTDGSGNATVNLGFEPQYIMGKVSSAAGYSWEITDSMRGLITWNGGSSYSQRLKANSAEIEANSPYGPTSTGFTFNNGPTSTTFIYMAIRRPNKPPTSGTQVFTSAFGNNLSSAGTIYNANHVVDLLIGKNAAGPGYLQDRLRGPQNYISWEEVNTGEAVSADWRMDSNSGINYVTARSDLTTRIGWMFKRAPGFMDIVCYTGNSTNRGINHNLGVAPELVLVFARNLGNNVAYLTLLGPNYYFYLNNDLAVGAFNLWYLNTTASQFFVSDDMQVNRNTYKFVAYLFASLPGVSKISSYTGNGSSQTINCGFAAGARFILIKRSDAAGDWYVWDTARGIVSANDPHLSLNTTAAEVTTDDSIDPDNSGFIVNQVSATNINVTSATYIYLAIA